LADYLVFSCQLSTLRLVTTVVGGGFLDLADLIVGLHLIPAYSPFAGRFPENETPEAILLASESSTFVERLENQIRLPPVECLLPAAVPA
jgi:hypothetical protein